MPILLANPRGFCAGVDRAITIVERALALFGSPIYVRHEVVHNRFVVDRLRQQGAIFVESLDEIPDHHIVIFSAHGVSQAVHQAAKQRPLKLFDATCPLVTKVHMEVHRHSQAQREVILIGHAGHPEVEGTLGQYHPPEAIYLVENVTDVDRITVQNPDNLALVTQTTLSVDDTRQIIQALQQRFPLIQQPQHDDICYATQNRQDAVRHLAQHSDLVLVVGSPNSSNSNRLRELAKHSGTTAYLIDNASDIKPEWLMELPSNATIGVTAGASAPESLVQEVIQHLQALDPTQIVREEHGREETMVFALPKELRITSL